VLGLIVKRMLWAIPTLGLVSLIGFTLMRFDFTVGPLTLPGSKTPFLPTIHLKNPIDPLAGLKSNPQITPSALAKETARLGLDKPFFEQYRRWMAHVLQFHPQRLFSMQPWQVWTPDLGQTFTGQPVTEVLAKRAGNTLLLNVISLILLWGIALPLGVYAAINWRGWIDRAMTLLGAVGMAMPGFVLALLLAVWAVKSHTLPLGGLTSDAFDLMPWYAQVWDVLKHLALPVLVMTVAGVAGIQRQMRSNMLDVLGTEYIRTARAKGLPESRVLYKHALRVAINPLITLLGYEFAGLLSGAVLIETVLGFPGVGYLTYNAVQQTDTNLVMATLILSASMLILGNLFADILLMICDPRIRDQHQ
jgi:peptide/nickel transport system permease protein